MTKYLTALDMCLHMFIAIPLPKGKWDENLRRLSTACLPIVGLLIGGLWLLISCLSGKLLPSTLSAAVMAAFPYVITGFIHLDGYLDTADALFSWRDRKEKLKILKDVHAGSFAVVLMALLMLFQFAACLSVKTRLPLLMIPVLSRCGSAFCVLRMDMLGHSEYAGDTQEQSGHAVDLVLLTGIVMIVLQTVFWSWRALIVAATVVAGYAVSMRRCVRVFGGVSGDLAGFALTVSELCGLIALAIIA